MKIKITLLALLATFSFTACSTLNSSNSTTLEQRNWIGMDAKLFMDIHKPPNVALIEIGYFLYDEEKYGELVMLEDTGEPMIIVAQCEPDEDGITRFAVTKASKDLPLPSLTTLSSPEFRKNISNWIQGCTPIPANSID